jgi:FAD/FMN-containing dehydrogenase
MPSMKTVAGKRLQVAKKLQGLRVGEVFREGSDLRKFSRDQSIYEFEPLLVVLPSSLEGLQKVICFAVEEGLPITPRGGGSGTAGGALGEGIVVALPRNGFFGTITDFSETGGSARARVGAGVYHDDFQKFLKERGFFLPADVSSAGISQLGGNIATKASGPHALMYGSIDRFVEDVEFFTARGELVNTADPTTIPTRFRDQLQDMACRIRENDAAWSFLKERENMKIASGYNLFAFLRELPLGKLVAQLLVGSNGTLGFVTGATLRGKIHEPERAAMLLFFDDLQEAGRAVCAIRDTGVAAIEIMNRETARILRAKTAGGSELIRDAHILLLEFSGQGCHEAIGKVRTILKSGGYRISGEPAIGLNDEEIEKLWAARKQILWLIRNPAPHLKALSVVNDVGVPPAHLVDFILGVEDVLKKHNLETMIYGHAGSGNLHLRPLFDVTRPDLKEIIGRLADDVYEVVFRYGGTISAEHGIGRLRTPYLHREWGETLYQFMRELKSVFDPQGIFNPGVMFSEQVFTDHMRSDLATPFAGRNDHGK